MTVRECLEFAARLKLPGTEEEKLSRVDDLIATLKLKKCENTKIGGPLVKGVSGGERKRTSIGVELITDPSLIFLDEPTTGLDSFTATSVMATLGQLAQYGNRTVVSTIHQPNSDIFEKFDRLLLLARGKIIYFNEASKSVEYFASINFPCPELSNPCDYFMTMMSKESIEFEIEDGEINQAEIDVKYEELINMFDKNYQKSALKCDLTVPSDVRPLEGSGVLQQTPWFYQFNLLAKRNFLNLVRLP
jgi:ABC-type multidrug transport system ATPase subunit